MTSRKLRQLRRSGCGSLLCVAISLSLGLGCGGSADAPDSTGGAPEASIPIRLLVVDDDGLAETVERLWNARAESPVVVEKIAAGELVERPRLGADVVIYPTGYVGMLAERNLIAPLTPETLQAEELNLREVFELIRLREIRWGREVFAVPFGSPQLTVAYRKDVLEAARLSPPTTWVEYQNLVKQLSDRAAVGPLAPSEGEWVATTEPLGPGWAGQVLLARSAPYARHPSQYSVMFDYASMEPLIGGAPFVRALTELVEAARGDPALLGMSPADAYRRLLEGRTAMALAWPTRMQDAPTLAIGFAELPGSPEVYNIDRRAWEKRGTSDPRQVPVVAAGGRMGSITREARRFRDAANMLVLLSGSEWSAEVSPASVATTVYRKSHARKVGGWTAPPLDPAAGTEYFELVERTQSRAAYVCSIRIPGRDQYLAALDEAVHAAVRGDETPEAALVRCADRWRAVTESLGVEAQKKAYSNSLGL